MSGRTFNIRAGKLPVVHRFKPAKRTPTERYSFFLDDRSSEKRQKQRIPNRCVDEVLGPAHKLADDRIDRSLATTFLKCTGLKRAVARLVPKGPTVRDRKPANTRSL